MSMMIFSLVPTLRMTLHLFNRTSRLSSSFGHGFATASVTMAVAAAAAAAAANQSAQASKR
jgi:hypothetical protein